MSRQEGPTKSPAGSTTSEESPSLLKGAKQKRPRAAPATRTARLLKGLKPITRLASTVRTAMPEISSPESPDLFKTSSSSSQSEKGTSPASASMSPDLFPSYKSPEPHTSSTVETASQEQLSSSVKEAEGLPSQAESKEFLSSPGYVRSQSTCDFTSCPICDTHGPQFCKLHYQPASPLQRPHFTPTPPSTMFGMPLSQQAQDPSRLDLSWLRGSEESPVPRSRSSSSSSQNSQQESEPTAPVPSQNVPQTKSPKSQKLDAN